MKTASLAGALLIGWSLALAPQAWAQDATIIENTQPTVEDAPAEEVVDPGDDVIQPGTATGEEPAGGEAQSDNIEATPPAQSVIEGTIEAADPQAAEPQAVEPGATFVMPDVPVIGVPVPGGMNYQPAVTSIARDTHWLSHWIHGFMVAIVALVVILIAFALFKFSAARNPNPARFTHNTKIEITWTLAPVLILIVMASFSLPILFKQLEIPDPQVTIKATGHQWYWSYEYPDNDFSFESIMLTQDELADHGYGDDLFQLATDTAVVVPVGAVVKMQVTASDVIHSWTIPSFGVKMDGIPGRLNEIWFEVDEPGVFFGQCSELCGKDHAFMPITVKALAQDDYAAWLDWAIDEFGGTRGEANVAMAN